MKRAFSILFATGICATMGLLLAWWHGGQQEEMGTAIGGFLGFAVANGVAARISGSRAALRSSDDKCADRSCCEAGFAYGVFAVGYFAFIGWLTGFLHGHGDLAGTVCGGLGGFILAVIIPTLHQSEFMAQGRKFQFAISAAAFAALLRIVWAMYEHELMY